MMSFRLAVALVAGLVLTPAMAAAQQPVTGRVVSAETLAPVRGASVVVEGTTIGAITNENGMYTIPAPSTGVLIVSVLGFGVQRVPIAGRQVVGVTLTPVAVTLESIVAVGYGSQSRPVVSGRVQGVTPSDPTGERCTGAALPARPEPRGAAALPGVVQGDVPPIPIPNLCSVPGPADQP